MTLWRPPQIPYLSDFLFGHWPDGDEDAMRRAATHWSDMANALKELQKPADQAMVDALDAIDGKAHSAMASYWADISGGDGSDLQRLINTCESFAEQLEHGATDIEHTKLTIYISAMVMLAMTAWSWLPGAGQVGEVAAAAAVKVTIRAAVEKLLTEIATKGAAFVARRLAMRVGTKVATQAVIGAGIGAGTDAAAQGIQLAEGHRQDGFDLAGFFRATGAGAVAGSVAGPMSEGIGGNLAGRLAGGAEPGLVAGLVGKNVAEVPANVVGNAAAQLATNPDHSIDSSTLLEGAGGGLASKPGPHNTPHGDATAGPHADSTPDHPAAGGSEHSPTADPPPRPSSSEVGTPSAADGAHPSGTHSDPGAVQADAPPAAHQGNGTDHAATVAAGHETSVAAQPDSNGASQAGDAKPPTDTRPNGGTQTPEPGSTNQPAQAAAPSSDRSAPPSQAQAPNAALGDRQMPAARPAPDVAARPDAQTPAPDRNAPQRIPESSRSPVTDAPVHRTTEPPTAGATPRPEATPARPGHTDAPARPEAAVRPVPDSSHRPPAAAERPSGTSARPENPHTPSRPAHPSSGRNPADLQHTGDPAHRNDASAPHDPGRPADSHVPEPGSAHPDSPRGDRVPGNVPRQDVSNGNGRLDQPAGRPESVDTPTGARADSAQQAQAVPVGVPTPARDPGADHRTAAHEEPGRPTDHRHSSDGDNAGPEQSQSGGAIRPRNPLDVAAQDKWAGEAYDTIRSSRSDVHDMVENLAHVPREDGSVGFTEHEIGQVKQHLFEEEHKLSVFDDNGNVVGHENRRFDADPDIAEAWMRLSRGEPLPADITLLEHELAESNYLREHPDAGYREAHAHANTRADWESDIPERTGENYQNWGEKDGPVRDLPEDGGNRDRSDLPVREQRDGTEPRAGDREDRPGRQSGGRNERPAGDEGSRTHSGAEGERPELAGRGRDSSLSEGAAEPPPPARGGGLPPDIAGLFPRRRSGGADGDGAEPPGSSWDPAFHEGAPRNADLPGDASQYPARRDSSRPVSDSNGPHSGHPDNHWRAPESGRAFPVDRVNEWRAPENIPPPPTTRPQREHAPEQPHHGNVSPHSARMETPRDRSEPRQDAALPRSSRHDSEEAPPTRRSDPDWPGARRESQPLSDTSHRVDPRAPEREQPAGRPPRSRDHERQFAVRRSVDESGQPVSNLVVRVHLDQGPGVSNQHMRDVAQAAWAAAAEIMGPHQRLPWGDRPCLRIEFVADPTRADLHAAVDHSGRAERGIWPTGASPEALAGRLREHLGLPADHDGQVSLNASDLQRLSDRIADTNTDAPLRGLPETREVGPGKLAPLEDPSYQEYVRNALREGDRFATWFDPRTHEAANYVNDGGPEVPGRRNSCGDNIMAGLSCFYGDPQISHPRHPDLLPDGSVDHCSPEQGVIDRISDWLGADWQTFGYRDAASGFAELHDLIDSLGPGSSAAVAVGFHARDPRTGLPQYHADGSPVIESGHGIIVVYPRDAEGPVWWDPLMRQASDRPFPNLVADAASLHAIPLTQDARPYVPQSDSHSRGSGTVPGRRAGHEPEVPDVPVRTGLGDLPDPVRTGDRSGPAHRSVEDGAGRPERSDYRTPEPAGRNGGPDVHGGDPRRHPNARRADLPAANSPAPQSHSGQSDHSRVPDPTRIDNRSAADSGLPGGDRQGYTDAPAARNDEHHGGGVDRPSPTHGRGLAQQRDHSVLGERNDFLADGSENGRPEQETSEEKPDHEQPGPEQSRATDDVAPQAESKPNLGDLIPPDGSTVDEARVLPLLQRAIDGEYGGLRVSVESVSGGSHVMHVATKIYDAGGNQVGYANRTYYNMEGRIVADHTMFRLDSDVRGQGCANELNNAMFAWYRQSGVDEVMLRANIDVGSYAWARQGFEFANQQAAVNDILPRLNREVRRMRADLAQLEREQAPLPDDARDRKVEELGNLLRESERIVERFKVGSPAFPTPAEIAKLGRPEGLQPGESRELSWPGKRVFMEPGVRISWHGVKKMQEE
ncbi:toxin glutamine deamidase domain-containing protein [Nocardia africana]|uniref:Toxin glutamine deamidase domain-containing protein n=1 Tax=Nocardia africana TaxID=134964 RepID=A0ABW6NDW2_9NOCA